MNTDDHVTLAARQMESIKFDNLLINFTTEFRRIWDSSGSKSKPAAFWRPSPAPDLLPGFFPLGDVAVSGHDNINEKRVVMVVCEAGQPSGDDSKGLALRPPTDFEEVWRDTGSGARADCSIWRPIPPEGYVALGQVCSNGRDKPLLNTVRCVRADLVVRSFVSDLIWNDKGSGAKRSFSAWGIFPPDAQAGRSTSRQAHLSVSAPITNPQHTTLLIHCECRSLCRSAPRQWLRYSPVTNSPYRPNRPKSLKLPNFPGLPYEIPS